MDLDIRVPFINIYIYMCVCDLIFLIKKTYKMMFCKQFFFFENFVSYFLLLFYNFINKIYILVFIFYVFLLFKVNV